MFAIAVATTPNENYKMKINDVAVIHKVAE